MNFWLALAGVVGASVLVYIALSINGKDNVATEAPGHGHDDHGHGAH
jgi:hypothetical protein